MVIDFDDFRIITEENKIRPSRRQSLFWVEYKNNVCFKLIFYYGAEGLSNYAFYFLEILKNNENVREFLKNTVFEKSLFVSYVPTPCFDKVSSIVSENGILFYLYMVLFPYFDGKNHISKLVSISVSDNFGKSFRFPFFVEKSELFCFYSTLNGLSVNTDFESNGSFGDSVGFFEKHLQKIVPFQKDFIINNNNDLDIYLNPVQNPFHEFLKLIPSVNQNINEFLFLDLAYNDAPKSGIETVFRIISGSKAYVKNPEKYRNVKFSDFELMNNIDDKDALDITHIFSKMPVLDKSFREHLKGFTLEQINRIVKNISFCHNPEAAVYMCDLYKENEIDEEVLISQRSLFLLLVKKGFKENQEAFLHNDKLFRIKKDFDNCSTLAIFYLLMKACEEKEMSFDEILDKVAALKLIFSSFYDNFVAHEERYVQNYVVDIKNNSDPMNKWSYKNSILVGDSIDLILIKKAVNKKSAYSIVDDIIKSDSVLVIPGFKELYSKI